LLKSLRAAVVAVALIVGPMAVVMVPGPAEAAAQVCHGVNYGGYSDTTCYVASWSSPDPGTSVVDCVVSNHTAGDYKVVIVFHFEGGRWTPVSSNAGDSSTWVETSYTAGAGSPGDYLCWGGIYSSNGGALLDAAVQYPG
jgi:hypothetical protein